MFWSESCLMNSHVVTGVEAIRAMQKLTVLLLSIDIVSEVIEDNSDVCFFFDFRLRAACTNLNTNRVFSI